MRSSKAAGGWIATLALAACGGGPADVPRLGTGPEYLGALGIRREMAFIRVPERPGPGGPDSLRSVDVAFIGERCTEVCTKIGQCIGRPNDIEDCSEECLEDVVRDPLPCASPMLDVIDCLVDQLCFQPIGYPVSFTECGAEIGELAATQPSFVAGPGICDLDFF
jgi:hypothetical protein